MPASGQATPTVIIITKSEATDVGDCIRSAHGWADDIIIFDSGGTDGTQDICHQLGARVLETD